MNYETLAIGSRIISTIVVIWLLYFVFTRYMMPGIRRAQKARNDEVARAEHWRDQMKATIPVAVAEREAAEHDAAQIREQSERAAGRERERILRAARAEGERTVHHAEGELIRARQAAEAELRAELIAKAVDIARGAASYVDEATNRRLIGETVGAIERPGAQPTERGASDIQHPGDRGEMRR